MYETLIDLSALGADSKILTQLEFTKPDGAAATGIFAVSGMAAAPESIELTTGFHVSWPSNAESYVLEEAESANGPWVRSQGTPIVVEGQNIVVMDMQSRSKFYRLVKSN